MHRAAGGGALGRRVGQFERLFDLQVRQALDLEDATGEDVLLALLLDRQQTLADRVQRDRIDQVAQRDARLQRALEAHQHRFRHVQRHHAGGGGERHQAGAGREGDADREAGVAVAASADGIGQQQAVEPGVDDAVARTQADAATRADEARQLAVRLDIDQLGIGGGVAEGLHHHVGREAEAGEVLEFVASHRAGGVLRADGGHLGFAVGARTDAQAFRQTAGAADHLLRQRKALAGIDWCLRQTEQGADRQTQRLARLGGQATADDQRNTAAGAHFVENHQGLQLRFGNHGAVLQRSDLAGRVIDPEFDLVAHIELAAIDLDRQRAGIFHGVEEDRRDLGTQTHAAETLVRHEGDVLAGEPQHRVGRGLARGAGADHVADVGDQVALGLQVFEEFDRTAHAGFFRFDAGTRVLQHRQGVQRDVGARPGVRRRRQVVGVGFAGDFEHGELLRRGDFRAAGEPLGVGPRLHHGLGVGVARRGEFLDVMEIVEHQQGRLQTLGGHRTDLRIAQQVDHRFDVEATQHGAQQFGRLGARHQPTGEVTLGNPGQKIGLDLGRIIDACRYPVRQQFNQKCLLAGGRVLEQFDELSRLFLGQGQRGNAEGGTLGDMGTVSFKHGGFLPSMKWQGVRNGSRTGFLDYMSFIRLRVQCSINCFVLTRKTQTSIASPLRSSNPARANSLNSTPARFR